MCFGGGRIQSVDSGAAEAARIQAEAARENAQFQRELFEKQLSQQQLQREEEARLLDQARREREAELAAEEFRKEQERIDMEEAERLKQEAATSVGGTKFGSEDLATKKLKAAAFKSQIPTEEDDQMIGFDPLKTKQNQLTGGLGFNAAKTGGKKF